MQCQRAQVDYPIQWRARRPSADLRRSPSRYRCRLPLGQVDSGARRPAGTEAHLYLNGPKTICNGSFRETYHFLVRITKPIPATWCTRGSPASIDSQSAHGSFQFSARRKISNASCSVSASPEMAKVDASNQLLRAHICDQAPDWLAFAAGRHVPCGVDDGTHGHVHDTFLGSEPTQLGVVGQAASKGAEIRNHVRDVLGRRRGGARRPR